MSYLKNSRVIFNDFSIQKKYFYGDSFEEAFICRICHLFRPFPNLLGFIKNVFLFILFYSIFTMILTLPFKRENRILISDYVLFYPAVNLNYSYFDLIKLDSENKEITREMIFSKIK